MLQYMLSICKCVKLSPLILIMEEKEKDKNVTSYDKLSTNVTISYTVSFSSIIKVAHHLSSTDSNSWLFTNHDHDLVRTHPTHICFLQGILTLALPTTPPLLLPCLLHHHSLLCLSGIWQYGLSRSELAALERARDRHSAAPHRQREMMPRKRQPLKKGDSCPICCDTVEPSRAYEITFCRYSPGVHSEQI